MPPATAIRYRRGTHRTVAPEEMLERVRPALAAAGITRIANITGLDRVGIPTVLVCRPNSRSVAVAQGKGVDLAAAKASGVMEALETFHAETITLPLKYASRRRMAAEHRLIDVDRLPRCGPDLLPMDTTLLWIEARDLGDGGERWTPFEVVSADYTLPLAPGAGVFQATTNGLASGNAFEEACLHALTELIERDAVTLWRLGGTTARRATRLDLASIDDPVALDLLDRFERARVEVGVWETTSAIGVPTFVALVAGEGDDADPELGAGCHPASELALARALCEAAQARVGFISGARDDLFAPLYAPEARRRRAAAARAWLDDGEPRRRFEDVLRLDATDLDDECAVVRMRLEAAGFGEIAMVDLAKPALAIPVVRAIVPGLEGPLENDAGFQPGRRARALLEEGR